MKIFNETLKNSWNKVVVFLKGLDNLYLKFILTIIAIALSAIAIKLPNPNKDYINVRGDVGVSGDVSIYGSVDADVSGSIDTYEQN